MRAAEDEILKGYRWVDRNNNIVRIPVADAMKLTLQRGLPSRQQAREPRRRRHRQHRQHRKRASK